MERNRKALMDSVFLNGMHDQDLLQAGSCIEPVVVTVIDSSPGSSFSVPRDVFTKLTPSASGSVAVSITEVNCWQGALAQEVIMVLFLWDTFNICLVFSHCMYPTGSWQSCMQVDCSPPGNIQLIVQQYRASGGGYLKAAVFAVRGPAVKSLELRTSGAVCFSSYANLTGLLAYTTELTDFLTCCADAEPVAAHEQHLWRRL